MAFAYGNALMVTMVTRLWLATEILVEERLVVAHDDSVAAGFGFRS